MLCLKIASALMALKHGRVIRLDNAALVASTDQATAPPATEDIYWPRRTPPRHMLIKFANPLRVIKQIKNAEQTADESKNECECKDGYVGSLSPTTKEPYWTGRCAPNEVTALDAMLNNNQDAEAILNQYLLAKDENPQYKAGKEILEKARDNLIKVKSRYRNCCPAF